jgi:hypothetical protein
MTSRRGAGKMRRIVEIHGYLTIVPLHSVRVHAGEIVAAIG